MKRVLALLLCLMMVLAMGATSAVAEGEVIGVMYGGGTPESMDPALNSASAGSNRIRLAFCGLMGPQAWCTPSRCARA